MENYITTVILVKKQWQNENDDTVENPYCIKLKLEQKLRTEKFLIFTIVTDSKHYDADPDLSFTLIWISIRIRLLTLMRIRILLLIKEMQIWSPETIGLQTLYDSRAPFKASKPPLWASTALHRSILSFLSSWIFTMIRSGF